MAKVRKLKKKPVIITAVIIFFLSYLLAFKIFNKTSYEEKSEKTQIEVSNGVEDKRSLISQLNSKTKIYLSTKDAQNIKVELPNWEELRMIFNNFSKIRKVDNFSPVYDGYSEDGLRFSTDLNFFRVYNLKQDEFYKVSVSQKEEFKKLLDESIYTSFDFAKQYKTWEDVTVSYLDETKNISKWKFDDLSYKLVEKRVVGKVQPEKSRARSEHNFKVNIKGSNYYIIIETMGSDYVKITSEKGESYYEVPTIFYDYLKKDIFKIK